MAKLLLSALVIAVACLSAVDARPKCPGLVISNKVTIPVPICTQTLLYDFANQLDFTRPNDTLKFDLLLASTVGLDIAAKSRTPFDKLSLQYTFAIFKMYGNAGNFQCLKTAWLKTLDAAANYKPALFTQVAPLGVFFRAIQGDAVIPFPMPAGVGPFALVNLANAVNNGIIPIGNVPVNIPLAQFLPVVKDAGILARNMQPYFMLQATKC